jgi:hypothetical protein
MATETEWTMGDVVYGLSTGAQLYMQYDAASDANDLAKNAQKMSAEQTDANLELQKMMLFAAAEDKTWARTQYQRILEQQLADRTTKKSEQDWMVAELEKIKEGLASEREEQVDRRIAKDKEAMRVYLDNLKERLEAKETAFKERDYAKGEFEGAKQIAKQEREYAESEIKRLQSVLSGERDEDLKRLYLDRAKAEEQQEYQLKSADWAKQQFMQERGVDAANRADLLGRLDKRESSLEGLYASMGAAPELDRMTRGSLDADLDREYNRIYGQKAGAIDRAATIAASEGNAERMDRGVGVGTYADDERSRIASTMSVEYQKAQEDAYKQALAYITGQQGLLSQNVSNIYDSRNQRLGEVGSVYNQSIADALRLPALSSATDAARYMMGVGDGIYDRDISSASVPHELRISAGDYNTPIGMNSAYVTSNLGELLSGLELTKSGVNSDAWRHINSAILGEAAPSQTGSVGNSAYADAASMAGNATTAASNAANAALKNSVATAALYGQGVSKMSGDISKLANTLEKGYGSDVKNFWNNLWESDVDTSSNNLASRNTSTGGFNSRR